MEIPSVTSQNSAVNIAAPVAVPAPEAEDRRVLIHAVRAINAAEVYGQCQEVAFALERGAWW